MRRTARLGDGWLASAYNTTPQIFEEGLSRLGELLVENDKDPDSFPNSIATMWFHITEDKSEAHRVLTEVLQPVVKRPADELRERLPIGPAEEFAERLAAYKAAGAQRVFLWPLADHIQQITRFQEEVAPLVTS